MSLFTAPWLPLALIAVVLAEGAALTLRHRTTGQGPAPRDLWPNLLAGGFILCAWSAAVAEAPLAVAACLAASGLAHLTDIARRGPRRTA